MYVILLLYYCSVMRVQDTVRHKISNITEHFALVLALQFKNINSDTLLKVLTVE